MITYNEEAITLGKHGLLFVWSAESVQMNISFTHDIKEKYVLLGFLIGSSTCLLNQTADFPDTKSWLLSNSWDVFSSWTLI